VHLICTAHFHPPQVVYIDRPIHHWGNKKIPLRNIVAMIHHKPKEKFQYVVIKKLRELNSYINHFEPLFNESEVHRIADYLMKIKD